ncbi:MAG: hypothetical protein A6F72_01195 [Cycloclasticus sp. symbiont of Poecilosclerida sp. N]|nr:MAG: hypothetical protein A6F72_01195 [Cycloclasticus sp. symbiont of Poecilosclerida sp. N]
MFKSLYNKVLLWAQHPKAKSYLFVLSVSESSFFPIPPDVMLAPMCLAKPLRSYHYAFLTTLGSVLGGVIGYFIGLFSFGMLESFITMMHYEENLEVVKSWLSEWGFWAIFISGFSPIPYKLFTITAGLLSMAFLPFVIASIIGRGSRFFLVAFLVSLGGEALRHKLNDYIEHIGWLVTGFVIVGIVIYKLI